MERLAAWLGFGGGESAALERDVRAAGFAPEHEALGLELAGRYAEADGERHAGLAAAVEAAARARADDSREAYLAFLAGVLRGDDGALFGVLASGPLELIELALRNCGGAAGADMPLAAAVVDGMLRASAEPVPVPSDVAKRHDVVTHAGFARWRAAHPAVPRALSGALAGTRDAPPELVVDAGPARLQLDATAAWLIAGGLPQKLRRRWELLFSTEAHGASFATLVGRCSGRGATVVVVRDKQGAVFGAFAPESWAKKGEFHGAASGHASFLFTLLPTFWISRATGANSNYQWLAVDTQTLPNGVGLGGQVGHFALFVEDSMEHGHTRVSATYANPPATASQEGFDVDAVEVWGIDPAALEEFAENEKRKRRGNVLDVFREDRAFLQISTGKGGASDGL